jgi:ribosomal protein S27AE
MLKQKYHKFCSRCGEQFEAETRWRRLCPKCKKTKRERIKEEEEKKFAKYGKLAKYKRTGFMFYGVTVQNSKGKTRYAFFSTNA